MADHRLVNQMQGGYSGFVRTEPSNVTQATSADRPAFLKPKNSGIRFSFI